MTVYQLDECINSKRFASDCEANAAVRVWRYPNSLRGRGASDAEMLATLLQKGNPILTTDLRLLSEWSGQIPDAHPGIVVVGHSPLQERFVRRVLAQVKSGIPTWAVTPISNSILTISEEAVEVHRVQGASVPVVPLFRSSIGGGGSRRARGLEGGYLGGVTAGGWIPALQAGLAVAGPASEVGESP